MGPLYQLFFPFLCLFVHKLVLFSQRMDLNQIWRETRSFDIFPYRFLPSLGFSLAPDSVSVGFMTFSSALPH